MVTPQTAQNGGLNDEERPTDDEGSPINTSDIETGTAVRGTAVLYTREENNTDEESVEVFDATKESLQREVTPEITEREGMKCQALYDLLYEEGRNMILTVLSLVITRTVGKTPEELLSDETVRTNLKKILPEESHRILSDQTESRTSIDVLCGLIQLLSNQKPKSGWGNPVKESDIEIGDDVERLRRVFSIFKEISNPAEISLKNYVFLLKKVLTACSRLKPDDSALENKCQEFFDKLEAIIKPNDRWPQLQVSGGYEVVAGVAIASLAAFILHNEIRRSF